jgi:hypothetical protein
MHVDVDHDHGKKLKAKASNHVARELSQVITMPASGSISSHQKKGKEREGKLVSEKIIKNNNINSVALEWIEQRVEG